MGQEPWAALLAGPSSNWLVSMSKWRWRFFQGLGLAIILLKARLKFKFIFKTVFLFSENNVPRNWVEKRRIDFPSNIFSGLAIKIIRENVKKF